MENDKDGSRRKKISEEQQLLRKIRQREHVKRIKEEDMRKKLAGMPIDYSIYSTEEEEELSDYEVNAEDIHPRRSRR